MRSLVEKPAKEQAPSSLAVIGRYILDARIFDHLARTRRGLNEEIQLTDAIASLIDEANVYTFPFAGEHYDCGSQSGYLRAILDCALDDPATAEWVRRRLGDR